MASPMPAADRGARALLLLACFVVVIAGLKAAGALLQPFLIAVFVTLISLPLLNWFQRRMRPAFALTLTVLADLLVLAAVIGLVGGSIQAFIDAVPRYQATLQDRTAATIAWLGSHGIEVSQEVARDWIDPSQTLEWVTRSMRGAVSVLSNAVLVALAIAFMLSEAAGFPAKLEKAFGKSSRGSARFQRIQRDIQRYLAVKTLTSLATGILIGFAMWMVGIDFPVLWGLLAFVLNYIPTLGSIFASIPPILLAIVGSDGLAQPIGVALIFFAVNIMLGNVIEPHLMGRRLGVSTLVVFASVIFWGWVWPPVGMLVSVPLTVVVKIMLENTEDLRWVAVLLDGGRRGRHPKDDPVREEPTREEPIAED